MSGSGYREVEHTADWALEAWGPDLPALCRQAAFGMIHLMGVEVDSGEAVPRTIDLSAPDAESLLVRWLEEILYDLESRHVSPTEARLRSPEENSLKGTILQHRVLRIGKPIKAVTFNDLRVRQTAEGRRATIVFDV